MTNKNKSGENNGLRLLHVFFVGTFAGLVFFTLPKILGGIESLFDTTWIEFLVHTSIITIVCLGFGALAVIHEHGKAQKKAWDIFIVSLGFPALLAGSVNVNIEKNKVLSAEAESQKVKRLLEEREGIPTRDKPIQDEVIIDDELLDEKSGNLDSFDFFFKRAYAQDPSASEKPTAGDNESTIEQISNVFQSKESVKKYRVLLWSGEDIHDAKEIKGKLNIAQVKTTLSKTRAGKKYFIWLKANPDFYLPSFKKAEKARNHLKKFQIKPSLVPMQ